MNKIIKKTKKSQIWISLVTYVLIATMVLILVLQTGVPLLNKMREKALFSKTKDVMFELDQQIREVASEGVGSQRAVYLNVMDGQVSVRNDQLVWDLRTKNKLIESGTRKEFGNVVITSNTDVYARTEGDYFILENTYLIVNFSKKGFKDSKVDLNINEVIQSITLKETESVISEQFNLKINNDNLASNGIGYTELLSEGNNLGFAIVIIHMDSNAGYSYDLEIMLDSYADFISIDVKNFRYQEG